jgi:hypothetical protein
MRKPHADNVDYSMYDRRVFTITETQPYHDEFPPRHGAERLISFAYVDMQRLSDDLSEPGVE